MSIDDDFFELDAHFKEQSDKYLRQSWERVRDFSFELDKKADEREKAYSVYQYLVVSAKLLSRINPEKYQDIVDSINDNADNIQDSVGREGILQDSTRKLGEDS